MVVFFFFFFFFFVSKVCSKEHNKIGFGEHLKAFFEID